MSLLPVLDGSTDPVHEALFWHYPHYGNQGGEPSSILMEDNWKLIYYHEDERHELYDIDADIGEQQDIIAQHPERAKAMQKRLADYLANSGAKFPAKDPQFDAAKREARWKNLGSKGKDRLEKQHANFLKADYTPNKNWWGSVPTND